MISFTPRAVQYSFIYSAMPWHTEQTRIAFVVPVSPTWSNKQYRIARGMVGLCVMFLDTRFMVDIYRGQWCHPGFGAPRFHVGAP